MNHQTRPVSYLYSYIYIYIYIYLPAPQRYSCASSTPLEIDASIPGEIVSPGFPGKYPNNRDCTWKLKAPLGSVVRVKITSLNLEQYDSITLFDGSEAYSGNVIGK